MAAGGLDLWVAENPGPVMALIGGVAWLLGKVLVLAWPHFWRATSNQGLCTKSELDALRQELSAGDRCFAELREAQSDIALTIRDLCKALEPLHRGKVDCERLRKWITSGHPGR